MNQETRTGYIIALLAAVLIALFAIQGHLRDIKSILYDIKSQNELRELLK